MEYIYLLFALTLTVLLFVRLGEISSATRASSFYLKELTKSQVKIDVKDQPHWYLNKLHRYGLVTKVQVNEEKKRQKG